MDGLRVGDQVELTGEITSLYEDGGSCQPGAVLHFGACSCWIDMKTLLAGRRVARPLAIGDRVRFNAERISSQSPAYRGELVAIRKDAARGDVAFVDWEHAPELLTPAARWLLNDLELAPAPDTKEGTT